MWSELFFTNLKESLRQFVWGSFSYSNNEIEYTLYEELKSERYREFLSQFTKSSGIAAN